MPTATIQPTHGVQLDTGEIGAFRQLIHGPVLVPGDDGYDDARRIWNQMIDRHPRVIARCVTVADVQHAVAVARAHDLLLSIRGGGHNIAGSALCDAGLTIDLSR